MESCVFSIPLVAPLSFGHMAQPGTGRYGGRIAGWKVPTTRVLRRICRFSRSIAVLVRNMASLYLAFAQQASGLHIRKDRVGALRYAPTRRHFIMNGLKVQANPRACIRLLLILTLFCGLSYSFPLIRDQPAYREYADRARQMPVIQEIFLED